jgi:hypothetical protein
MYKKYIVRLSDVERDQLNQIIKKLSGSSQKVRRAQILLKTDADGLAWTDGLTRPMLRRIGQAIDLIALCKGLLPLPA